MFTSANVAAARLSVLEEEACFAGAHSFSNVDAGGVLKVANAGKTSNLGSSLISVAALISKLDENQPSSWEGGSSPTLRLQPLKKPEEALQIFLDRVESARSKDSNAAKSTNSRENESWEPATSEISDFTGSDTLNNIPCQVLETRRSAYKTLAKRTFSYLNFERAYSNKFNTSTELLVLEAQKASLPERVMIRARDGVAFHAHGWTLSTTCDQDPASLLKACRTAAEIRVSKAESQNAMSTEARNACRNHLIVEANSLNTGSVAETHDAAAGKFITRLISELLDVAGSNEAEQQNVPETFSFLEMSLCTGLEQSVKPVNAMAAASGLSFVNY